MPAILISMAAVGGVRQSAPPAAATDGRDADRAAIRAHIESIFQAFIDGDVDRIHATHSEDWRGFLEGSRTPIKGTDEYMRANGITWRLRRPPRWHPSPATR